MSTRIDPALYAQALADIRSIPSRTRVATTKATGCGTYPGYRRHRRRGQQPCAECTSAARAYNHTYYLAHKERIKDRVKARRRKDGGDQR